MDLFLYFFRAYPRRTILVFFAVTVASVITAITLLVLPALLFTLLGRSSAKTQFINDIFTYIGLTPSTENLIFLFLAGITIQAALLASANIYAGFTKAKVIKDLRIKFLISMSQTEWAFFTKQSTGNFTASLVNQIKSAGDGYETMVLILSNGVQIIAYLSVAFFISWQIACIAIVVGFLLTLLFRKLINTSKALGAADMQLTRMITSQLTDSYRSIKPLKSMARESHSQALLSSYTKQLKSVAKKDTIASELLDALQEIILMSTVILTIYFSFKHLDIPIEFSIILVILYLKSMKLFGKSQKQYQVYVGNISAFQVVIRSLNDILKNREHRSGTIKHTLQGNIEFKNVSFMHGQKLILDNASATFYHNKLNTIIGPSGEGKTTTADLLCSLFQPTSGEILIDNIPLEEIDTKFWREQIGYVTQENNLLNTTIKENITLGDPKFSDEQIEISLKRSHCMSFVKDLPGGINTQVGENGARLSGGQRQRVLIARALVHSPKLLILDEATSALDSKTEELLSEIFNELSQEMTIISISHRPSIKSKSHYILELSNKKLNPITI
jgi:ATP-binding cassette subfamily C protein